MILYISNQRSRWQQVQYIAGVFNRVKAKKFKTPVDFPPFDQFFIHGSLSAQDSSYQTTVELAVQF